MTKHERNLTVGGEPLPMLCSVERVARELDCSTTKIYRMIYSGRLRSIKIDGLVRIKREDLEALCAKNSGSGSTGANMSPSEDAARASNAARSDLRRDRIARRKPN